MVFLEANAAGKPAVGCLSGGAAEAIRQGITGFLVNPEDSEELVQTLQRLLLEPGLAEQLGTAGLNRVRAEFSWESRAEALREFSLEVAARARASQAGPAAGITRRNDMAV